MLLKKFLVSLFISLCAFPASWAAKYCSYNHNFNPQQYACVVVESSSGSIKILQTENANKKRYPASLTKLMTLYLTFEALHKNKINLNSNLTASSHASVQQSMKIYLNPGEKISVRTLINSLVVASANDSAVVLAEKLGGSEKKFASMMTQKAHQLGMWNTHFTNASGLYNSRQVTTAMDMAKLMIAIKRDFPQYYSMLAWTHFSYKGINYGPHTELMRGYKWAKAAKTGFIAQSGFNLVLNAKKNNENLVAVVMGGPSAKSRDNFMRALLENSFNSNKKHFKGQSSIAQS